MKLIKVIVTEHDSWSGSGVTEIRKFKRRCDATRFVNKINGQNTGVLVPDYYLTARIDENCLCSHED